MKKDNIHNIKSTGFKTAKGYFDAFEDKFFERLQNEDSIEDVKTTGYTIPKDYFDSVEDKVFSKLDIDDKPFMVFTSRKTFYNIAGIAASLVLLFAVFLNKETTEEPISVEMVEAYFENSDLDSYELAQLLSDADVLEDDFIISETNYNEENLESYLLDNADIEAMLE